MNLSNMDANTIAVIGCIIAFIVGCFAVPASIATISSWLDAKKQRKKDEAQQKKPQPGNQPEQFPLSLEDVKVLPPIDGFVGRGGEIQKLHAAFQNGKKSAVISGMGGLGKTEFARAFAWEHFRGKAYWLAFQDSFPDTFAVFAPEGKDANGAPLPPDALARAGLRRLREELPSDALLIIDDVRPASGKSLPEGIQDALRLPCHVLFTSRPAFGGLNLADCERFPLGPLAEDDCILVFASAYSGKTREQLSEAEAASVREIVRRAKGLTIVLELLGKTCRAAGISPSDMLSRIEREGFSLENITEPIGRYNADSEEPYFAHMAKLFDIAGLADVKGAEALLKKLCVLDMRGTDIAVIQELTGQEDRALLNKLNERGWLKIDGNSLSMHDVISDVLRAKLKPQYADVKVVAIILLLRLEEIRQQFEQGRYTRTPLVEHAAALLKAVKENEKTFSHIANRAGRICELWGEYERARSFYAKDVELSENIWGEESEQTAAACNNIALVYKAQGKYTDALELYKKAIAIDEKVLGTEHPGTATDYNNIASVYKAQGKYADALEYYKEAIDIDEKVLGTDHPGTAIDYNNIAAVYDAQGNYADALEFYKKAIAIDEKVLGTEHPGTATDYNNIGALYYAQEDYQTALQWLLTALGIREKVLGTEHPDTISSYENIAADYEGLGDTAKAEEYRAKANARKGSLREGAVSEAD